MRYFSVIPIIILLVTGCWQQPDVSPLDAPVSSLADLPLAYQPIKQGSVVPGRLKTKIRGGERSGEWRYNSRGQLTEWRHYRFGEVESVEQYRYDAAGKLRFVQHYANDCRLSSLAVCTGPVSWVSYDELTTDAAGRVTESWTYLNQGGKWEFRSVRTYAYNAQGQLVTVLTYTDKQVLTRTETLTYDARGNVVAIREQSTTAPADLADRTFQYTYGPGRNPYANTVYYAAAFFLSPNLQSTPNSTYEYRADGQPSRINENGGITELAYY